MRLYVFGFVERTGRPCQLGRKHRLIEDCPVELQLPRINRPQYAMKPRPELTVVGRLPRDGDDRGGRIGKSQASCLETITRNIYEAQAVYNEPKRRGKEAKRHGAGP